MMENDDDDDLQLHIPEEILIQILVCLHVPVVSLLRFKSVCKSWSSLIKSSFFIHLHTLTSSSSSNNRFGTFIFQTLQQDCLNDDTMKTDEIFMLSSSSSSRYRSSGNDINGGVFEMEDLGFPPLLLYKEVVVLHNLRIMGSCNGIVCLYDSKLRRDVCLWNPATRQFKLLPKSLTFEEEEEENRRIIYVQDVIAFGFDVKTKDYKVVKITNFVLPRRLLSKEEMEAGEEEEEEHVLRIQVYSLSSNSWRLFGGGNGINSLFDNNQFQGMKGGLNMNGSYFFIIYVFEEDRIREWILSFDYTKEIFTTVKFPDELLHPKSTFMYPKSTFMCTYFGGGGGGGGRDKIAFFIRGGGGRGDIWVLNEHDDQEEEEKESYYWTKLRHLIEIRKRIIPIGISSKGEFAIPIGISNDGEFALIGTITGGGGKYYWKLQLFNLVTKEEKTVFPTSIGLAIANVYKPSLVSIIGGNGAAAPNRVIGGAM